VIYTNMDMIVPITPSWWSSGPTFFSDSLDVFKAIDEETRHADGDSLLASVCEIRVGVERVELVVHAHPGMNMLLLDQQRAALVVKLDALVEGYDVRKQSMLRKVGYLPTPRRE